MDKNGKLGGERIIRFAHLLSYVALKDNADLILSPQEDFENILACYLASIITSKPWTAVFQPASKIYQPTPGYIRSTFRLF
jgi:hypothetical protein